MGCGPSDEQGGSALPGRTEDLGRENVEKGHPSEAATEGPLPHPPRFHCFLTHGACLQMDEATPDVCGDIAFLPANSHSVLLIVAQATLLACDAIQCLCTDWGADEVGRDNHAIVSRVNEGLKKRGLHTWFDGDRMASKHRRGVLSAETEARHVSIRSHSVTGGDTAIDGKPHSPSCTPPTG